jgi:hypothetical protein
MTDIQTDKTDRLIKREMDTTVYKRQTRTDRKTEIYKQKKMDLMKYKKTIRPTIDRQTDYWK